MLKKTIFFSSFFHLLLFNFFFKNNYRQLGTSVDLYLDFSPNTYVKESFTENICQNDALA
jgi:hypothetical protein